MNAAKKTTLIDRLRAAIKAFRGKPIGYITYGLEIKECRNCEYRNGCGAKTDGGAADEHQNAGV